MDDSLDGLAHRIEGPPIVAPLGDPGRRDRLDDLATWWASAGPGHAPQRVERFWPADVAFEAPAAVPEVIAWAIAAADAAIDRGADLVTLSLPASADPAAPAVLAAYLFGLDAVDVMGFPAATGLHDLAWMIRVNAVRDGLRRMRGPLAEPGAPGPDPEVLLERLGDRCLAAGCAVVLRCAARRTPLVLDGLGAVAAAAFARHLAPATLRWWVLADALADPAYTKLTASLRQEPLTRLGLVSATGGADGTGAEVALSLLELALARAQNRSPARVPEPAEEPAGDGSALTGPDAT